MAGKEPSAKKPFLNRQDDLFKECIDIEKFKRILANNFRGTFLNKLKRYKNKGIIKSEDEALPDNINVNILENGIYIEGIKNGKKKYHVSIHLDETQESNKYGSLHGKDDESGEYIRYFYSYQNGTPQFQTKTGNYTTVGAEKIPVIENSNPKKKYIEYIFYELNEILPYVIKSTETCKPVIVTASSSSRVYEQEEKKGNNEVPEKSQEKSKAKSKAKAKFQEKQKESNSNNNAALEEAFQLAAKEKAMLEQEEAKEKEIQTTRVLLRKSLQKARKEEEKRQKKVIDDILTISSNTSKTNEEIHVNTLSKLNVAYDKAIEEGWSDRFVSLLGDKLVNTLLKSFKGFKGGYKKTRKMRRKTNVKNFRKTRKH